MKRARTGKSENTADMAFKGRLYPNKEQQILIAKIFGCCRFVYNRALDARITEYKENRRSITLYEQINELPYLKKQEETEWLKEADSTALQYSLRTLQDAYDNFFRGLKKKQFTGFPKFKSKHSNIQSYHTVNNNESIKALDNKHVVLPKLGTVKCRMPRIPQGRIINATVTRECDGKYYVSICSEEAEKEAFAHNGKEAGIDLGIRNLAVTSDGEIFDNPHSYERNLKKLRRLQRRLSRKQNGSQNRNKQRIKVAALYKKIRNQRTDAIHKMTTSLVKNYDIICMEDLNVKSMVKNKRLARYISDASFGEIRRQFEYKCGWHKRKLIRVDRWYPSSQICSECGYINKKTKNPAIRYWKCPECGKEHDRDINAAINILHKGISA